MSASEEPQLSPEQKAAALRRRQAALLKRWLDGGRVTPSEISEIGHLVPAATLAEPPPPPQNVRGMYREQQPYYAALYGCHVRTIKGWIGDGRTAGELPPLDEPAAMPGWWTRVHPKRNVPTRILAAAESKKPPPKTQPPTPPSPKSNSLDFEGVKNDAPPPPPGKPEELGYAASLQRLRIAERDAHQAYEDAKKERDDAGQPNHALIEQARRAWNAVSEQLRFQEKSAAEVLGASGEMLFKVDVRRQLVEMHGAIVGGVRSLLRRTRAKVGNIAIDDAAAAFDAEVDRVFAELISSEFAPVNG